ncbi:Arc family DNA-binding protein [Pseudomonas mediterranea]|uniref:Arc family DNA-binding protein n=1 Tax=Pseudomonas mediterranea TaxID=183795 RepID=UPI001316F8C1|nr:Arc family DNA-binding protein [Pseudomonas mediterranea]QHA83564.1 Arc family DNA-binding protein [Pseudomonas mediterranea]
MSRTDPQFNLRIPESLRDLVMTAAKRNKRSATAEILDRLERSFTETDELGISDSDQMNPEHALYVPYSDAQVTTRIHKDRLLAGLDDPLTPQEKEIMSAMIQALRRTQEPEDEAERPNKRSFLAQALSKKLTLASGFRTPAAFCARHYVKSG